MRETQVERKTLNENAINIYKKCNCYGCVRRNKCECCNCKVNKKCKTSFCIFKSGYTYQCTICLKKFDSIKSIKIHRLKENHVTTRTVMKNLPTATWFDLYMSGQFEEDIEVKRATESKSKIPTKEV